MEPLPAETLRAGSPAPDEDAERSEIRRRVADQLARLPEQRRTAFRLVEIDGLAVAEAAHLMALAPGTIRSHVHHARKELRAALSDVAEDRRGAAPSPVDG